MTTFNIFAYASVPKITSIKEQKLSFDSTLGLFFFYF